MIANHGMKVRYHHEILGVNSRLDSIQAAILNVKLKHLEEYQKARYDAAQIYTNGLKDIESIELLLKCRIVLMCIINIL